MKLSNLRGWENGWMCAETIIRSEWGKEKWLTKVFCVVKTESFNPFTSHDVWKFRNSSPIASVASLLWTRWKVYFTELEIKTTKNVCGVYISFYIAAFFYLLSHRFSFQITPLRDNEKAFLNLPEFNLRSHIFYNPKRMRSELCRAFQMSLLLTFNTSLVSCVSFKLLEWKNHVTHSDDHISCHVNSLRVT